MAPEVGTAPPPRLCHPKNWALYGAREHLDDWDRVQSIFIAISNDLEKQINEANEKKGMMEAGFAEEFMRNIDWLMDTMGDRRRNLREEIGEAI